MWNKYTNKETMQITSSSEICEAFCIVLVVAYYYVQRDKEVLKSYLNNFSFFELSIFFS